MKSSSPIQWKWLTGTAMILFFFACASIKSPPGGPKDDIPPRVDSLRSTPNMQTWFDQRKIQIYFDEWITTGDAFNQVVISPPLEYPLEINGKGRSIQISFDPEEKLRENATYTINFGEYVKDFTAGNPATDLRFIFSTGPYIDSLVVSGTVKDAFSMEAVPDVLVMLYAETSDSVVQKEKPFYFGRTDASGNFRIENVRAGDFKLFGLIDNNLNYLYDLPKEQIAFSDSLISVSDSTPAFLALRLFTERLPLRLLETATDRYGYARASFSREPFDLTFEADPPFRQSYQERVNDSLRLWYLPQAGVGELQRLYFSKNEGSVLDTLEWEIPELSSRKDSFLRTTAAPPGSIHPDEPLILSFSTPLQKIDTEKIILFQDTLIQPGGVNVQLDSLQFLSCSFQAKWKEGTSYRLLLLPAAVTDIFQLQNDSLSIVFKCAERKQYGELSLNFGSLPESPYFIIRLLDNGGKVIDVRYVDSDALESVSYPPLKPGEYTLEMIADKNGNQQWDPGNYYNKQQPEPVFRQKLEQLRANWELAVDVNWE
jgi:hypothetical protein